MTATVTPTEQRTGLVVLAEAVEAARAAHRAADAACDRVQMEHDEAVSAKREIEAARKAAVAAPVSLGELRAIDRRLEDAKRRAELTTTALQLAAAERERAKTAQREAEVRLGAAHRRAKALPQAIHDIVAYLVRRRNELGHAERVAGAIRGNVAEYEAMALHLRAEFRELTGEDLEVTIT